MHALCCSQDEPCRKAPKVEEDTGQDDGVEYIGTIKGDLILIRQGNELRQCEVKEAASTLFLQNAKDPPKCEVAFFSAKLKFEKIQSLRKEQIFPFITEGDEITGICLPFQESLLGNDINPMMAYFVGSYVSALVDLLPSSRLILLVVGALIECIYSCQRKNIFHTKIKDLHPTAASWKGTNAANFRLFLLIRGEIWNLSQKVGDINQILKSLERCGSKKPA